MSEFMGLAVLLSLIFANLSTPMHRLQRAFYSTRSILPNKTIKSILKNEASDAPVSVTGWIRSVRKQKQLSFAVINDGSNLKGIQAILNNEDAKA